MVPLAIDFIYTHISKKHRLVDWFLGGSSSSHHPVGDDYSSDRSEHADGKAIMIHYDTVIQQAVLVFVNAQRCIYNRYTRKKNPGDEFCGFLSRTLSHRTRPLDSISTRQSEPAHLVSSLILRRRNEKGFCARCCVTKRSVSPGTTSTPSCQALRRGREFPGFALVVPEAG